MLVDERIFKIMTMTEFLTTEHLCSMFSLPRELPVLASTSSCTTPYAPYSYNSKN